MTDWRKKRQDNLDDLTLNAHLLTYFIIIIMVLIGASGAEYNFHTTTVVLLCVVIPAALFILLDYYFLQSRGGQKALHGWNIFKHALLFAVITAVLAGFPGEFLWLFSAVYLLPAVLSCTTLGKRWGLALTAIAVGCIFLLTRGLDFAGNRAVTALEAGLVLGSIFFVLAWFLGSIIEVEKETTEFLRSLAEGEQHRYRELFEFAPVGYLVTDEAGAIKEANLAAKRLLQLDGDNFAGMRLQDFLAPPYRDSFRELLSSVPPGKTGRQELEIDIKPQFGPLFPALLTVEPTTNTDGKVTGLRWLLQDITIRRRAEAAIREKEIAERMRQERDLIARMMDTSPAGILVLNRNGDILYANNRAEKILGLKRQAMQEIFKGKFNADEDSGESPCCLVKVFQAVMEGGKPVYNYPATINRYADHTAHLTINGAPIFNGNGHIEQVVLTVDDITKQKKMTEEMLKADKVESLSLLAGGIAHDFNNFLAVILGNISLVRLWNKDQKIAENLEHMEKAALRARELTRKLSIFTRGSSPSKKTVYLQKLLPDTVAFALSGSAVVCEMHIPGDLKPVEADEAQLVQVFHNILINAVQAMPEGGRARLEASHVFINGGEDENAPPLPRGDYVLIRIADEGTGIPGDKLEKIFDPFYSTKPAGSGLGLTTARMIVQNHGGLIQVKSTLGIGSTFSIYLPVSKKALPDRVEEKEELEYGKGRVLIMDDDELVLKSCGKMLEHLGYRVSYASEGAEAVRIYREAAERGSSQKFDAVILDLTVPGGIGGKEAIRQLRQFDPAVKAIVSSGYSDDPAVARYRDFGFSGHVNKPYRIKELSAVLKAVLEAKRETGPTIKQPEAPTPKEDISDEAG